MTKVLADILLALDTGDLSMLTLLDLSAAFDTVDHQIRRLETSYGLGGVVLSWFRSYLDGRTHQLRLQFLPEFHRGRSSDRFCFCFIQPTCCD